MKGTTDQKFLAGVANRRISPVTYIQPLTLFFLLLAVIGLLRLRKSARPRLLWIAVAGLFLLSWPPADWLFSKPLEIWYPVRPSADHPYQAIVVLSSDVRPSSFDLTRGLPDKDTMERCECAAWLYRQKPVPVLACGGRGRTGLPYSVVMRDLLVRAGVPPEKIWTEERSHSTHENAVLGARILRAHGVQTVALVVEAQSMMRGAACFRREGIAVVPSPSAYRTLDTWQNEVFPGGKAIIRNEVTLHEYLGLLWYRLHGWI